MRVAGWAFVLSSLAACSPLRMTAPETGAGGAAGTGAGTGGDAGSAGAAGTQGSGGTGGTGGMAGTMVTGRGGSGGAAGSGEPPGLIAHWKFNEGNGTSVVDNSGNGQPMRLSASGVSWTPQGREGSALTFDGASGFAEMMPTANQPLYNYPIIKLTFSAWVKPTAAAVSIEFATAVARAHEDYAFEDFWIGVVHGKPACMIHNSDWLGAVATAVAPTTAWTHIACTYAMDGQVLLYVNGAYVAMTSSSETIGPIPPRILVGADEFDAGGGAGVALHDFFPGAIDDVRIYNETLTPAQIAFIAR